MICIRINEQVFQIRFYSAINSMNTEQVPHCKREFLVYSSNAVSKKKLSGGGTVSIMRLEPKA